MNLTKAAAKKYIYKNSQLITSKFRPLFHAVPPVGWMGDMCSLIFYHNSYHFFYQFNPYGTTYGPVHAGHIVSYNLTHFYNLPVALAPDRENVIDCYAGGALVNPIRPNNMLIAYTQRFDTGTIFERQNIARTKDGVNFIKNPGSLLNEGALPPNAVVTDFRDPHPVVVDDYHYVFLGSKTLDNVGQILVYRLHDLIHTKYYFTIGPDKRFGTMAEHPDFFTLNGKDVLLVSALQVTTTDKNENTRQSLAIIGKMDFANKHFRIDSVQEIDLGPDFYAAQTMLDGKGRRIMVATMGGEGKPFYAAELGLGWSGLMTYPRELSIKKGILFQYPVAEFSKTPTKAFHFENNVLVNKHADLFADIDTSSNNSMDFVNPDDPHDFFTIAIEDGYVIFDSMHAKHASQVRRKSRRAYPKHVNLRVVFDSCSMELFINFGEEAITALIFIDNEFYRMSLNGNINTLIHSSAFYRGRLPETKL